MVKKPQIKQEQVDAVNKILRIRKPKSLSKSDVVRLYVNKELPSFEEEEVLNGISLDTLIRILYTRDYKIIPTYKKNQWIHLSYTSGAEVLKIKEVINNNVLTFHKEGVPNCVITDKIRPASPWEIKQEKEDEFWRRNNRATWNLKKHDRVCDDSGECFTVNSVEDVMGETKVIFKNGFHDFYENVKELYKIEYFAEDRKI